MLARIREAGVEPAIVEYVKTPPSTGEIKTALKALDMTPRALLRRSGTPYDALGLDDESLSDAALIAAMAQHSLLIQRPVVFTRKGTRLCRPVERSMKFSRTFARKSFDAWSLVTPKPFDA